MIKYYISLQFKLFNRKLEELGTQPFWGYMLILITFIIISQLIFIKVNENYALIIYAFIGMQSIFLLADQRRNNFIKTIFSNINYRYIRMLENVLLILPFSFFLIFKTYYTEAALLLLAGGLISLINMRQSFNYVIPTPFGKKPFEFLTGFRKTILIFPIAIYIIVQAIAVQNFNLGIGVLLLIYLILFNYYLYSEDSYFVWIYDHNPRTFLVHKITTAFLHSAIFIIPVSLICILIDPGHWFIIPIILVLANIYLTTIILCKYSNYPHQVSIPQGLLLAFSLMFPILLFYVIPFFYKKSIRSLNQILL